MTADGSHPTRRATTAWFTRKPRAAAVRADASAARKRGHRHEDQLLRYYTNCAIPHQLLRYHTNCAIAHQLCDTTPTVRYHINCCDTTKSVRKIECKRANRLTCFFAPLPSGLLLLLEARLNALDPCWSWLQDHPHACWWS
jgi:hypothetical protein